MKNVILIFIVMRSLFTLGCGLSGSIQERIKDCNKTIGNFSLVAKNSKGVEIYLDNISSYLWSDNLHAQMTNLHADEVCRALYDFDEAIGIDADWRLPSRQEFSRAFDNGISSSLPDMEDNFWTASRPRDSDDDGMYVFNAREGEGYATVQDFRERYEVRCVAYSN